jgi:PPK2 family polyphosphate:nucleotide phosphotransferase
MTTAVRSAFRLPPAVDLDAIDPAATPIGPRSKGDAARDVRAMADELEDMQESLYADGVGGGRRRLLLVLQGMDTSGKGGVIKHVGGLVNPLGLHIASFKKPTRGELAHHFLWRIRKQVPRPGMIGIFDRSHYEDVLIVRVNRLVPATEWRKRFGEINAFEAELAGQGVTMIKCCLNISAEEQRERLLARLDNPAKRWKYNPGDLDARAKWNDYQRAYGDALRRCSTDVAPWYVIPSDRKWYRNWAIAAILRETLAEMAPQYPTPDFDVDTERAKLLSSGPLSRAAHPPPRG